MRMIKSFVSAFVATLFFSGSIFAQSTYTDKNGDEYEFKKHAFLNIQGGGQYTLGEAAFGDLISPNAQLGLGYQFNPWFGARVSVNAWQSMGGFNGVKQSDGSYGTSTFKYKYVAPGVDAMFNLSNLLCGWNPGRVLSVSAFVGLGANIAFSNDEANELNNAGYKMSYIWDGTKVRPVGRGGVELAFRVSKSVAVTVEGNANGMFDHYNSKHGGNADWYFNGLVGVRVNLGKSVKKLDKPSVVEVVEEVVVPEPVQPVPSPEPVAVQSEPIRHDIFFTINSSSISAVEQAKVLAIADYMKANPGSKVEITGYADAGTGTAAVNDRISARRAKAVADMLTGMYGIEASRITSKSEGSRVQPFSENDKNRVSICFVND